MSYPTSPPRTWETLVEEERLRQDKKWGEQNPEPWWWLLYIVEETGELAQAILHTFGSDPNPTAKGNILKELVQVGALCRAMYEAGIRNGWLEEHDPA